MPQALYKGMDERGNLGEAEGYGERHQNTKEVDGKLTHSRLDRGGWK